MSLVMWLFAGLYIWVNIFTLIPIFTGLSTGKLRQYNSRTRRFDDIISRQEDRRHFFIFFGCYIAAFGVINFVVLPWVYGLLTA